MSPEPRQIPEGAVRSADASWTDADLDFTFFEGMLGRRWRLIMLAGLGAAAITLVVTTLSPIDYEASATLVFTPRSSTDDLAMRQTTIRTVLGNPNVIAEVLHGTAVAGAFTPSDFALKQLDIREIPNLRALGLRVRAPDPSLAEVLAKRFVDAAVAHSTRLEQDLAADERERLAKQTKVLGDRLKQAEDRVLEYRRTSQIDVLRARVENLLARRELSTAASRRPVASADPAAIEQLRLLDTREMALGKLETDYRIVERVYSDVAGRYEQLLAAEQLITPPVRLLESTIAPGVPVPRERVRRVALGLVAGLMVGVVLGVTLEARRAHAGPFRKKVLMSPSGQASLH